MSSSAVSAAASAALPQVTFSHHGRGHGHGHRKGLLEFDTNSGSSNSAGIGQLPVGVSSVLLSGAQQSLQQSVADQSSVSAARSTASTAVGGGSSPAAQNVPRPSRTQELQPFSQPASAAQQSLVNHFLQNLESDGALARGPRGNTVNASA
ncbi:MAG TPA: hypothetical protein VK437_09180 [Steroidobacteraceae bacterium]|nr:hypothetical protein [Steroidobacteraceae bacterium]